MRKQPASTPPAINTDRYQQAREQEISTQVRQYRLITPLFGGGVLPAEADPITIIRGSEIRGHLRFWWRACRGGQFHSDLQKMKEAEDKIWGAAHTNQGEQENNDDPKQQNHHHKPYQPTVQIEVEAKRPASKADYVYPFTASGYDKASYVPKYLAFPLELEQHPVCKNVTFTLTISFPKEYQQEVEAALWAWEIFGGVGARTRRGFGALRLLTINQYNVSNLQLTENPHHVRKWINDNLSRHVVASPSSLDIPQLSHNTRFDLIGPYSSAERAWQELERILQNFRQKQSKQNAWAGLKEVKQIVQNYPRHSNHPFPKAALGLPIVYHLDGDQTVTLQGASDGQERLASPIILRPFQSSNKTFWGLVLLFTSTQIEDGSHIPPGGLTLKWQNNERDNNTPKDITVPVSQGQENVLRLFMQFISERKQK